MSGAGDAGAAAMPASWSVLQWPGNPRVRGLLTTRVGGCSAGAYAATDGSGGMNLGAHVGDDPVAVSRNRELLAARLAGAEPVWLEQVHGSDVADLDAWPGGSVPRADAALLTRRGLAACVLVADCLPVLLAAPDARGVAAAHAGWRGLSGGVLEHAAAALARRAGCDAAQLQAWLGPAIGPAHFEVGDEVREAFVGVDARAASAFVPGPRHGKWMADLFELARMRLQRAGLLRRCILGGGICTVSNPSIYYSFRRDRVTGRQAALVWLD
jgi:YfiH family protein